MPLHRSLALSLVLALWLYSAFAQSSQAPASPAQAHPSPPVTGAQGTPPQQPQDARAAESPLANPAAYMLQEFGPSFKLAPNMQPLFGDFDGDGIEDIVLFATSAAPLLSREQFNFRAEDPYDAEFGTGNVDITSQFTLHIDGSETDLLIAFGWRQPASARNAKRVSKFVLINTPMETASLANLRLKKKDIQAIEIVDRTKLHSLVFWSGKKWSWSPQGMEADDVLQRNRR